MKSQFISNCYIVKSPPSNNLMEIQVEDSEQALPGTLKFSEFMYLLEGVVHSKGQNAIDIENIIQKQRPKETDLKDIKQYFQSENYQVFGITGSCQAQKPPKVNRQFLSWRIRQTYKVSPLYLFYSVQQLSGFCVVGKDENHEGVAELLANGLKINKIQIEKEVDVLSLSFYRMNNAQLNEFVMKDGLKCMQYLIKMKQKKFKKAESQEEFIAMKWKQITQIFKNILYKSRLNKPLKKGNFNLLIRLFKLSNFIQTQQITSIQVRSIENKKRIFVVVSNKEEHLIDIDQCLELYRKTLSAIQ